MTRLSRSARNIEEPLLPANPHPKTLERLAKKELALKVERAAMVTSFLKKYRICAVVTMRDEDTDVDSFMQGVVGTFGEEHVLKLPAEGNVQGKPLDATQTQETLGAVSEFRRKEGGEKLIVIEGTDFDQQAGLGTDEVVGRLRTFMQMQANGRLIGTGDKQYTREEATERDKIIFSNPMILAIGEGEPSDLTSSVSCITPLQTGFRTLLGSRFALGDNNELTTYREPKEWTKRPISSYLANTVVELSTLGDQPQGELGMDFPPSAPTA